MTTRAEVEELFHPEAIVSRFRGRTQDQVRDAILVIADAIDTLREECLARHGEGARTRLDDIDA